MSSHSNNRQHTDIIDQYKSQQFLQSIVNKVLQSSPKKSKYIDSFQSPKLPLSPKKSVYEDSYRNYNYSIPENLKYIPLKRNLESVVGESLYRSEFKGKHVESILMQSGKKKDNMKIGGPSLKQSSYSHTFVELKSRPMKESLIINPEQISLVDVKLKGSSTYQENYKNVKGTRLNPIKRQGSLKVNGDFIGSSTYKNQYLQIEKDGKINKNMDNFRPNNKYCPSLGHISPSSYQIEYDQKRYSLVENHFNNQQQ